MKEKYLEQIGKFRDEISQLKKVKKELDLQIDEKVRDADVLEARLSAVDSIIEASAIIADFTKREQELKQQVIQKEQELKQQASDFTKGTQELKQQITKLENENSALRQQQLGKRIKTADGDEVIDKPITPLSDSESEMDLVTMPAAAHPLDETLLVTDKKKSQNTDSSED